MILNTSSNTSCPENKSPGSNSKYMGEKPSVKLLFFVEDVRQNTTETKCCMGNKRRTRQEIRI